MFKFSPLLIWYCLCRIINHFACWIMMPSLVRNISRLQWPFDIRPTGTQICRRFKLHDLITCESKVQVVVSLGSTLWSFVRHRASWRFDQWHATRSPPIRKRILVGRYNNQIYDLEHDSRCEWHTGLASKCFRRHMLLEICSKCELSLNCCPKCEKVLKSAQNAKQCPKLKKVLKRCSAQSGKAYRANARAIAREVDLAKLRVEQLKEKS